MKKLVGRILIGVVILAVVAFIGLMFFLDGVIKRGIETVGPRLTQVDIKLDSVSLSLLSGSGALKGLLVGNPQGFKTASAIQVGTASLSLEPRSLLADKVIIKSINIQNPEITYETDFKQSNLAKIQANLEEAVGSSAAKTNQSTSGNKPPKKLQVDDFIISGAKVHLSLSAFGGQSATLPLPEIHLTGLGQGPSGITAAELTSTVLKALEKESLQASAGVAADLKKGALYFGKELTNGGSNALNKVTKGLGDLLKKK